MPRQLTIRGVPDEIAERLKELSRRREQSVNATLLEILDDTLGESERRERLQRYATWEARDSEEFAAALASQRVVDARLWE